MVDKNNDILEISMCHIQLIIRDLYYCSIKEFACENLNCFVTRDVIT